MKVKLINTTPNPEENLIYIARVSSNKSDDDKKKNIEKLIKYLIDNKHWSPFEHSFMTVEIETSRAIAHQIIRHRSMFFQEFSLRYSEAPGYEKIEFRKQAKKNRQSSEEVYNPDMKFFLQDGLFVSGKATDIWDYLLSMIDTFYKELLKEGVSRETARFVLPLVTKTKLYVTGNLRSWIHFLQIRDDEHAQKEIRLIAKEIKKLFIENFPITSKSLNWYENRDKTI